MNRAAPDPSSNKVEDSPITTEEGNQTASHHRTLPQKWRAVSLNNKLIVVFTAITAIATLFYSLFSGWTLYEIHHGSADTHTLAEAAKKQADKAETISSCRCPKNLRQIGR
jgi:hypothetical protein